MHLTKKMMFNQKLIKTLYGLLFINPLLHQLFQKRNSDTHLCFSPIRNSRRSPRASDQNTRNRTLMICLTKRVMLAHVFQFLKKTTRGFTKISNQLRSQDIQRSIITISNEFETTKSTKNIQDVPFNRLESLEHESKNAKNTLTNSSLRLKKLHQRSLNFDMPHHDPQQS